MRLTVCLGNYQSTQRKEPVAGTIPERSGRADLSRWRAAEVLRPFARWILFVALAFDLAAPWVSLALHLSGADACSCCSATACSCRRTPIEPGASFRAGQPCGANCSTTHGTQSSRTALTARSSQIAIAPPVPILLTACSESRRAQRHDADLYQRPPPLAASPRPEVPNVS